MSSDTSIGGAGGRFPTTLETLVDRFRDADPARRRETLERLARLYWKPVFGVIRHAWSKSVEEAKDLTQEFFATEVLERAFFESFDARRGSFRAFLKGALRNFLCRQERDAGREKRGGLAVVVPLANGDVDLSAVIADPARPDDFFDAAWRAVVLQRAVQLLEERLRAEKKEIYFEVFRRHDLSAGDTPVSYRALADEVGRTPEDVKNYLAYARRLLRETLLGILREYVDTPSDLAGEFGALFGS